MKAFVIIMLLCIAAFQANALSGRVPLLALTELSNGTQLGSATELMLDVRQGSDRVFLETVPLTKITTQVSLRFAKQIACHEFGLDCDNRDFFFAIKALPGPIVGGPSAGAAATVLVAATLQNATLNPKIAITGTINSGGLIGPVGGVDKKIQAAGEKGYTTVLIPAGTRFQKNPFVVNSTDLIAFGAGINVTVIEVATVKEAYSLFTGAALLKNNKSLYIDQKYGETMKMIANELCSRTAILRSRMENETAGRVEVVTNLSIKAGEALAVNASYSAASFCFRANVLAKESIFPSANVTRDIEMLASQLAYWDDWLEKEKIETLTDVQAYIVVQDRLQEAREGLSEAKGQQEIAQRKLHSYSEERLVSAKAWSIFFNISDNRKVSKDLLQKACVSKVSEAEERFNYVQSVLPESLKRTRRTLDEAYIAYNNESYISCIGSASKAKAEADVVMGLLGVEDSRLKDILDIKLELVRQQLLRAQQEGIFPIIGYSYYEYAQSLVQADISSALLFSEYALELSDLGIYVDKPKKTIITPLKVDLFSMGVGLLMGVFIAGVYYTVAFRYINRNRKLNRKFK